MLGDTPQPGETPRNEDDPWSFADLDPAWSRGVPDSSADSRSSAGELGVLLPPAEVTRTGDEAEAHTAGAQDVAEGLTTVEHDHDQVDAYRYDPGPSSPQEDVMVQPEPGVHQRPTLPLEHPLPDRPRPAAIPRGHHTEPLPAPTGTPATDARLERLENSPFWGDPIDDTVEAPPEEQPAPEPAGHRGTRKQPGRLLSRQVSLVALSLVAAFFAWVSAEPFWLAVGHGDQGYAITTRCTGDGVTQRCVGRFAAADGQFSITQVRLLGVEGQARQPGAITPARMVSPDSPQAYLGGTGPLLQLRWLLGFTLVLLCGYAISGVTRARRLETSRARRTAVLLSLAGPLALLAGFLAAAY